MFDVTSLPEPVELAFTKFEPSDGANADRVPVLLGHGLFGNKEGWADTPQRLADQTKRTIFVVDQRNHGESGRSATMTYKGSISDPTEL